MDISLTAPWSYAYTPWFRRQENPSRLPLGFKTKKVIHHWSGVEIEVAAEPKSRWAHNGYIIYEGPSRFDGKPIVVIATGFRELSGNRKTGVMIQTWIIRADLSPQEAIWAGEDGSICGGCIHRGDVIKELKRWKTKSGAMSKTKRRMPKSVERSCYVQIYLQPRVKYNLYKEGRYPKVAPEDLAELFRGAPPTRVGSYGDPVAAPLSVWDGILTHQPVWTGYTHAWKSRLAKGFERICMASVDNMVEQKKAVKKGWRTFRIGGRDAPPIAGVEIACPATPEGGGTVTCDACNLCMGMSKAGAKSIVTPPHGSGKVGMIERREYHPTTGAWMRKNPFYWTPAAARLGHKPGAVISDFIDRSQMQQINLWNNGMITLKKGGIGGTGGPMDRPAMTYTPQTLLWHLQIKLGDAHVPWKQACEWLRRADHALAEIVKKDGVVDRVVYNEFVREAVEYIRSPGRRPPTMRFEANPHRSGDTGWGETPVARRGAHRKSRASRVLRPGASAPSHEHGWQYPGHSERVEAHAARIEALGLAEDEPEKRKKKKKATRVKDFSNESSARSTQRPWHDQSRRRSRTAPTFSVRETLEGFHVAASRAGVPWHLVCKWLENAEDYLSRHANMLGRVEAPVALSVSLDLDRVVKKHGQKGVGRNRNPSPGHTHPMLKHPIPRGRVIGELYDLYYKAKLPGDPELSWPNSLSSKHAEDPRRYAQVFFGGGDPGIGGRGRPRVELAEQVRWLPAAQRRGLLAHEVGHIVYPEGTEDEADQAAYESTGVKIGYDHRWPGKGLQTARNPRSYWVFNYGSNDPDQIEDRVGRRLKGVGAVALGYERVFRGWSSTRQCGVASLKKKRGAVTYGWAGKLTEPELRELDRYEGVRSGNYRRKVIDIEIAETGERVEAITYIATSREYGKPSRAYLEACAKTVGTFWNEGNVSPDDFPLRNPGDRELREQQRLSAAGDPEATYRAMHDHKRRGTLRLTVNNLVTFLEAYPRSTAPQIAEFFRKPAGNAGRIIGIAARAGRIHSNEQELFQQIMQGVYQQHRIERPLVDVGIHGIESEAGLPVGTISSVRNRARSGAAWSAGSDYSSYNHDIVGLLDDAGIQMPREPSQHSGASSPSRKAKIVQLKQVEDMVRHAATIPHGPIVGYVVTTAGNRLRDLLAHLRKGARYDRGVKSEVHGITTLLRGPFRSAMNDVLRELRGPLR